MELHCIFKFSNRKTHESAINMFVFRMHKMIFFFFVNIMKQNLYVFLQTYVDLNFLFICLQNLSLFNIYIYILVFFFGLFYLFFFFGPKLDFLLIKFTLMLKHISYHLILYPHTHTHTHKTNNNNNNN